VDIVLLGPPGAGKGTQAKRLAKSLGCPHIASGDLFREVRREDTAIAEQVREYMDRGEYVPDQLTIELVLDRLAQSDAHGGFLLDGFPRTLPQAEALDRALEKQGRHVQAALYITAPTQVLLDRVAGRLICPVCNTIYNVVTQRPKYDMVCDNDGHALERRSDEDPEVVRTRLEIYKRQTQPLAEYYERKGVLHEIDGARDMDTVNAEVDDALKGAVTR
jgi:adenylate kinase